MFGTKSAGSTSAMLFTMEPGGVRGDPLIPLSASKNIRRKWK